MQGALQYDHAWSYHPEEEIPQTRFLPQGLKFAPTDGVLGYNDFDPRMGVVLDVFGKGKSALKLNADRYLEAAVNGSAVYSALQPVARTVTNVTRTWTDANSNFVADCNLNLGTAQDLRTSGGDFCGAWSNANFGQQIFSNSVDDAIRQGWRVRPSDWQVGASFQQQILPFMSVEAGYMRRWLQHFFVTDNLTVGPADFDQFSITAPLDARLPGGGGYLISGLYNVTPGKFGLTNNLTTQAANYGSLTSMYNGLELAVNARLKGLQLQAGSSTGRQVVDYCDLRGSLPEQTSGLGGGTAVPAFSPTNPYCRYAPGVTTRSRRRAPTRSRSSTCWWAVC